MKRILALLAALFLGLWSLSAAPAYPGELWVTQPDGTRLKIRVHGDEYHSYVTSGEKVVARGADGFWRDTGLSIAQASRLPAGTVRPRNLSEPMPSGARPLSEITQGDHHFLVILVEFPDLKFTLPDAKGAFTNLLNQSGYSENGGTGSVRDYYRDNSIGQFSPTFDVYGPVTVSKNHDAYGDGRYMGSYDIFLEACKIADAEIDYTRYDANGDGFIDDIFFYYAGHNQAEGAGEGYIWPHRWGMKLYFTDTSLRLDGMPLSGYACTSEYRWAEGNEMCGIGTFCHEFGHVLGLPDFYDTDGEANGSAETFYNFSLMSNGNYNNQGRTPPYLNCIERKILGWGDFTEWTSGGNKTVPPISEGAFFSTSTAVDGEFFAYEARVGSGWDQYVYPGLLIYHFDQSSRSVGGNPASFYWNNMYNINIYGNHPLAYIVPAWWSWGDNYGHVPFPGWGDVHSYEPTDWDGNTTGVLISEIELQGTSGVSLRVTMGGVLLRGTVSDSDGNPVEGATVSLALPASPAGGVLMRSMKPAAAIETTTTDGSGTYVFSLDESLLGKTLEVYAEKSGYVGDSRTVAALESRQEVNLTLRALLKVDDATLAKYTYVTGNNYASFGRNDKHPWDCTVSALFTAEEVAPYAGGKVNRLTFMVYLTEGQTYGAMMAFVNVGEENVWRGYVSPSGYVNVSIDLSEENIVIEPGKSLRIGYAMKDSYADFPFIMTKGEYDANKSGGFCYNWSFTATPSEWKDYTYSGNLVIGADVESAPYVPGDITLADLGYNTIIPAASYKSGDVFELRLRESTSHKPQSVSWFYDGSPASGSVTLSAGKHTIEAVLGYSGGATETLLLELDI